MAETIFKKVRTLVLSNAHDLLDRRIAKTPGALRQHVRDLEVARDQVADDVAVAQGNVSTIKSNIAMFEAKKEKNEKEIDALLGDGIVENDYHAMPLAEAVVQFEKTLAVFQSQLVNQQTLVAELESARMQITAKHSEYLHRLNGLELKERAKKARDTVTATLNSANSILGAIGATESVDNHEARLNQEDAISKARFERALASIGAKGPEEDVDKSKAAALIALRRKALEEAK